MKIESIKWDGGRVLILDQLRLPAEKHYVVCKTCEQVARAIETMQIRGAPAIGVAAAMGMALAGLELKTHRRDEFVSGIRKASRRLEITRPTAVNLVWSIRRMLRVPEDHPEADVAELKDLLVREACDICREDVEINRNIGTNGAALVKDGASVLTHCNAGALATAGYGTALGVIRAAHEQGKKIHVYVDETRPYLQGARLTAWELMEEKIPMTLISDNMSGYFIRAGKVDLIVVGADRIASNGDTANKIGTYTLSVLAKEHRIPFYVAAPLSTFDLSLADGTEIPIEQRDAREVTHIYGMPVAPPGVNVSNPAFDVSPHQNITAIITEKKVIYPPFKENIAELFRENL